MKKALSILLLIFCCYHPIQAQKIRFSDVSNTWKGIRFGFQTNRTSYHYAYKGDTSIHDTAYHIIIGPEKTAIREDTANNKVYFRFITNMFRMGPTDTLEHLLYDFTLNINDTFKVDVLNAHYWTKVESLDSTTIGGKIYKVWQFAPIANGTSGSRYKVIEGVGCVNYPLWPASSWIFEDIYQLQCFTTKGTSPIINPSIDLPYTNDPVPSLAPPAVRELDNDNSCKTALQIDTPPSLKFSLYPNPVSSSSVLQFEEMVPYVKISVYDALGKAVFQNDFSSVTTVPLGSYIPNPGFYLYTISDKNNQILYNGYFTSVKH